MNNIILSITEFFSQYKYSFDIFLGIFLIASMLTFSFCMAWLDDKLNKTKTLSPKEIRIYLYAGLISFIPATFCFLMISPKTIPENMCFIQNKNNPYKINKEYLPFLQDKVKEYNDNIALGMKFEAKNIDSLIKERDLHVQKLEKEIETIEKSKKYPLVVEYFVVKNSDNKMTIISNDKNIYPNEKLRLTDDYSYKRVDCSSQIVDTAHNLKKDIIGFNQK